MGRVRVTNKQSMAGTRTERKLFLSDGETSSKILIHHFGNGFQSNAAAIEASGMHRGRFAALDPWDVAVTAWKLQISLRCVE